MTALASAKIYTFPPRGRFALRTNGGAVVAPENFELPQGAELTVGGGSWYHDEAIRDEHNSGPRHQN